ncbi:flippase-like domain-containing protein [Bacillus sp. BHET2]|uniref:lysylphosphatidylglycerol synthase transmembrane domain-containing protein n=1 Tax=Bacillus sp. BHET2 TaxID=2583818 RepID=UPI00110F181D|nr:lysylphosphatidylglycerol synthase transmembrane domain-containing protein [Bacillus sp. BHET2]TMU85756.1 flippase-like domain-containing protein [Bacillus sp. BHET2]
MNKAYYRLVINGVRILLLSLFFILLYVYFDKEYMLEIGRQMLSHSFTIIMIVGIYFFSFLLKGVAWKVYLNANVRLTSTLIGLFYSLLLNHLLPLKVGDGVRVMVMNQRENISVERSFHSVFVLRVMDTLSLLFLVVLGFPYFSLALKLPSLYSIGLLVCFLLAGGFGIRMIFPDLFKRHVNMLKDALRGARGVWITALILTSWLLEGAILYGVGTIMGNPLAIGEAVWVNSVTILGQLFQFAPGGIGTYESIMSYTLRSIGIPLEYGLSMALFSHGLKFLFSYLVGGVVIVLSPVSIKHIKRWIRMKG